MQRDARSDALTTPTDDKPANAQDRRGWRWFEQLRRDIRLAVRLWARTPGFTAIAILTTGLGIGASTALVGQVKAVFWTPLPVTAPHELRFLTWTAPRHPFVNGSNVLAGPRVNGAETFGSLSYPAFLAVQTNADAVSDVACWRDLGEARPIIVGERGIATVQFVSGNYFHILGVRPLLGRTIEPADQTSSGWSPVVMISHRFWLRAFGGAADVTTRTLQMNGRPFAIVGVMPEGFFGLDPAAPPDIIAPRGAADVAAATPNSLPNPGLWSACRVVARIAPRRSDEEARVSIERVLADVIAATPPSGPYDPPRVTLVSAQHGLSTVREGTATPLTVLLVVVSGLLLAACANIGGLLLARGNARSREIATRLALGASRGRVIRQLVTESLVLSCAGGFLGLLLAYSLSGVSGRLLSQFLPTLFGADRALDSSSMVDGRVLGVAAALSVVSGLLFGALPALKATRLDLMAVIKDNARPGRRRVGLTGGHAMVAAQTALAVCLLVSAGLLLRTLVNLRSTNLGFPVDKLLYARIEPRSGNIGEAQRQQFLDTALSRLRALPGVAAAAATGSAPMAGDMSVSSRDFILPICPPTGTGPRTGPPEMVASNFTGPGYFDTLQVPMLGGRDFTSGDSSLFRSPSVAVPAIVNEALAHRYFPGASAIGEHVVVSNDCAKPFGVISIVGIVGDSRSNMRAQVAPAVFLPLNGLTGPVVFVARTAGDPARAIPSIRRAMIDLNANTPTFGEAPVSELVDRTLRRERLLTTLTSVFAIVTMCICCLGIYGLLAYEVTRRRREISVRMAVGAQPLDVVRLVVRESLVSVVVGLFAGAMLAAIANRWLAELLYGVSIYDLPTLAGAGVVLLCVAAAAAALPSYAATRVEPVLALKQ